MKAACSNSQQEQLELVIPRGLPRGALQFLLLTLAKRADFGFLRRYTQRLAVGIGAGRAERIYFCGSGFSRETNINRG